MPIPIVVFIAAGIVVALGGGVALNWDKIIIALKGKRLAVLGARAVGKTTLVKFLTSGTIPAEYKQTLAPDNAGSRRFSLKELDIRIKDTQDISGDKAAYAEWKELHDKADIVLYLMRADLLLAGDPATETRVRDDLKHISDWLESRTPRPLFFFIGTHCDLDPEFSRLTPDRAGDYIDRFRHLPIVEEMVARAGGTQAAKVVIGSMKTISSTEVLVYELFRQVQQIDEKRRNQ